MPIYEYKCKKCGEKFEQRLSILHDKKSLKCPKCGSIDPDRVFSPFSMDSSGNSSSCSTHSFG
jgi:putative FmdB family regulatory protein